MNIYTTNNAVTTYVNKHCKKCRRNREMHYTNRDFNTEYKTGQVNQTKKCMYELNKRVKIYRIRNNNKETAMIQRKSF